MTALALATLYLATRSRGAGVLLSCLLLVLVFIGMSGSLSARPQVLSFGFTAAVTALWLRAADRQRPPWFVVALTWLWASCHGLWVLSPLIGGAVTLGMVVARRDTRATIRCAAVVALSVVAAALTRSVRAALTAPVPGGADQRPTSRSGSPRPPSALRCSRWRCWWARRCWPGPRVVARALGRGHPAAGLRAPDRHLAPHRQHGRRHRGDRRCPGPPGGPAPQPRRLPAGRGDRRSRDRGTRGRRCRGSGPRGGSVHAGVPERAVPRARSTASRHRGLQRLRRRRLAPLAASRSRARRRRAHRAFRPGDLQAAIDRSSREDRWGALVTSSGCRAALVPESSAGSRWFGAHPPWRFVGSSEGGPCSRGRPERSHREHPPAAPSTGRSSSSKLTGTTTRSPRRAHDRPGAMGGRRGMLTQTSHMIGRCHR